MAACRSRFIVALGTLALLLGVSDFSLGLSGVLLAPGDLKARFRLDEGSGTSAADSSGNGNAGTLQNGPTWVAGQSGQAVSLDGTDDYISLGTGSALNIPSGGAFSLSAWVKTTESAGPIVSFRNSTEDGAVIDLAVGYDGSTTDAGKIMALVRQDSGTSGFARVTGGTVNSGTWRHVALVRGTTGTIELFLDGVSQGTNSGSHSSGAITSDLRAIGSERRWVQDTYGTADQRFLAGAVDEVHFYNRSLSLSEIQGLAHDAALEAMYRLDEGTGATAQDTSGNDDAGTLQNGPTWVAGQSSQAVSFDGTDDYISLGTGSMLNIPSGGAFSLSAWVKTTESYGPIVSFRDSTQDGAVIDLAVGFDGATTDTGKIMGLVRQDSGTTGFARVTGGTVNSGTWRHVALVRGTAGTIELFLDGVSQGTNSGSQSSGAITTNLRAIGSERRWVQDAHGTADQRYLAGAVDEVRFYSRALSATEVENLVGGTWTGLSAVYYDNMDWTGSFVTRTDSQVNFNWGTGSPDGSIGADTFSAVWTGQVQPQWSETYTFYTNTDDGVRLWVDGKLVIDYPQDQAPTERSGQITLSGGVKYNLRMEYFENGGGAVAELRWASGSTPKALIPQSQLYPTDTTVPGITAATSNSGDLTKVYVRFSEAMDKATAETAGNWTLSGGLSVSAAALSSDKKVATLTASGSVTLGTTQVTASSSILGITREALASPFTFTVVDGSAQGFPASTAITLIMTTDGNHSAVMFNEPSSHGVSQGVGEEFRLEAPGTAATTITLRQYKKLGGRGAIDFLESGSVSMTSVTTSGGSPNVAFVACRHKTTSAFGNDIVVEAVVAGEVRATKDVSVVELSFSTKYAHLSDQTRFPVTAQVSPALQGLELTNTTFIMDFGGPRDGTTPTTLFKLPAWSPTNSSGQATRSLVHKGLSVFFYDVVQLKRPQIALFNTVAGAMVCNKEDDDDNTYEYGYPESLPESNDYCSSCPNCSSEDKGGVPTGGGGSNNDVATKGGCGGCGGNSIDPFDGEKKLNRSDLIIRGRGLNYEFRRVYRSGNYREALAAAGLPLVRDFGKGWTYSYADDYLLKDGAGADTSANFINYRAGGSGNVYVNIGTGVWVPGKSCYNSLRKNPSNGDLEIREPDGLLRIYHDFSVATTPSHNGRLKAIEDRNGNRMTFHYEQIDPDNTVSGDEKHVLAYVIDTMGREIRYRYFAKTAQTVGGRQLTEATANAGAFGRLFHVRDFKGNMDFDGTENPDFAGQGVNRQLQFGYDSEGNLVKARTPVVLSTPTGNDFPNGKATRYKYYTNAHHPGFSQTQWDALTQDQRNRLLGKMTHIWAPNEVLDQVDTDPADSEAREAIAYETNTSARYFGFVTSYTVGGTNANGVPSGGTIIYSYTDLNPSRSLVGHPYNTYQIPALKIAITDRNGNQAEYVVSAAKTLMNYKEFPRGLRSNEATSYEKQYTTNGTGLLRGDALLTHRTDPEGGSSAFSYNENTSDRSQHGNLIRFIRTPGARGGDQASIEVVMVFEPIFNLPWLVVSARGSNSGLNGFTPPVTDPVDRTIADPYSPTKTLNLRYARVDYFDYQESPLASTAWSATSSWTPTVVDSATVKATEVLLVRELGLPEANDTERASSVRTVRTRLSANLIKLGLGDLNGDGITDPIARGNVIRTAYGSPVLLPNLNQHALETTIDVSDLVDQTKSVVDGGTQEGSSGSRLQTIVWMYQYNTFGQMARSISPEGNVTTFSYFAENDADGDTLVTPSPADGRTLSTSTGGYLKDTVVDATRNYVQQTTGSSLSGGISNNNTNPSIAEITSSFTYDDVGNLVTMTNGRGIRADYFVNEHDEVVQFIRASDVSGASTASPTDPLYNHSDAQQILTAFAFKSRTFFDYNSNLVLAQTEDRGNTRSVDGSGLGTLPVQASSTTPGLSNADSTGGVSYVDHLILYDRLDNSIESRGEVDSTRSLTSRYRYDGNQHLVLVIHPEGNGDATIYDERELVFQQVHGTSTRPSAGKYASGDPASFNRPGGSGTTPSTVTYNYDKDKNVIEIVDAADTDGDASNNSTVAGVGDVVYRYTYDGYNRLRSATDPLGNKTTYTYDPDSHVVRTIQDGDPVDDVNGAGENKTLSVSEVILDELSRVYVTHRVIFQTPDAATSRVPLLTDTPEMDSLAVYLSDAPSDTAGAPGASGISILGRMSTITEYDRDSRVAFNIEDDLDLSRSDYDGVGRLTKTTDSALSNGFSGGFFSPGSISGNLDEFAYDDVSNIIEDKETDVTSIPGIPVEAYRKTFIYNSLDRLQSAVENNGQTHDYRYDSLGQMVARTNANGPVVSRQVARRGLGSNASVLVNSYGSITRLYYDGQARYVENEVLLTASGAGDGSTVGATLEGVKASGVTVDSSQSGDGLISMYWLWDDNSQLLAYRDDNGNINAFIYDNLNRTTVDRKGIYLSGTSLAIAGGDSGSFAVALRGGITPVDTESAGTDIVRSYDPDSNITTLVDEAGNSFVCTHDALSRKTSCSITSSAGFMGTSSQTWKYDGLSRVTECNDNNGSGAADDVVCRMFYDSLSRKVEEALKIGSGSFKSVTLDYELDCGCGGPSASFANKTTYPDGRQVKTLYDRLDRLVSHHDIDVSVPFTNTIGKYEYIGKHRVATLTYQNNVRLTHIGQVASQNADVGFDANQRIVNHRWESFTSQALGAGALVVGFEHQDGTSTPASMYDRGNNKRIEYKSHDPGRSEQYKFDSAYRLTSPGSGGQGQDVRGFERGTFVNANRTSMAGNVASHQDWDLDGIGNWTRTDDNARVETRTHSDFTELVDRVVAGNTATLSYDKNGNAIDTGYSLLGGQSFPGGGLRLEWDPLNRLRRVWSNNNTPGNSGDDLLLGEYTYDAENRRVQKVVTNTGSFNGTTQFFYLGLRVLEERDASDNVLRQYTYGNYLDEVWTSDTRVGVSVAQLNDHSGSERHFYLSNTLSHVYGIASEGSSSVPGSLREAYEYDAYGKQTVISDGNDADVIVNFSANDVRTPGGLSAVGAGQYMYTGQRCDAESGLLYYKSRFLSPNLGRFVSRDPIVQVFREIPPYQYAEGIPTRFKDPTGFFPDERFIEYLVSRFKLSKIGRRALHDMITKQGLPTSEIKALAQMVAEWGGKFVTTAGAGIIIFLSMQGTAHAPEIKPLPPGTPPPPPPPPRPVESSESCCCWEYAYIPRLSVYTKCGKGDTNMTGSFIKILYPHTKEEPEQELWTWVGKIKPGSLVTSGTIARGESCQKACAKKGFAFGFSNTACNADTIEADRSYRFGPKKGK